MSGGITPAQRDAVRDLAPLLDPDTDLAGGVAVALAFGHRTSVDLDFFVPHDFDSERLAESLTRALPSVRVTGRAPGTLYIELRGIPTSILTYRYPTLSGPARREDLGVAVASPDDLVCMKLSAIVSRGAARDFWDLHVLLAHGAARGTLGGALELYGRKFASEDIGHVVRGLAYFGDAEAAPLPSGLTVDAWSRIKRDFASWVAVLD